MSRGPGNLQRAILTRLYEAPNGWLSWEELMRPFPFEMFDGSFYRAVRSLLRSEKIRDFDRFGERWIALPFGRSREDREVVGLARTTANCVRMVAQARGLPESAIDQILAGRDANDFRHLIFEDEAYDSTPDGQEKPEGKKAAEDT